MGQVDFVTLGPFFSYVVRERGGKSYKYHDENVGSITRCQVKLASTTHDKSDQYTLAIRFEQTSRNKSPGIEERRGFHFIGLSILFVRKQTKTGEEGPDRTIL